MGGYSIKLNKYNLLIVFILVLFLLSLTAVSAKDTNDTKILNDNKDEPVINSHDQVQKELKSEIINNSVNNDKGLVSTSGQAQDELKENNVVENNEKLSVENSDDLLKADNNSKIIVTVNNDDVLGGSVSASGTWSSITVTVSGTMTFTRSVIAVTSRSASITMGSKTQSGNVAITSSGLTLTYSGSITFAYSDGTFKPGVKYSISSSVSITATTQSGSKTYTETRTDSGSGSFTVPKISVTGITCNIANSSYVYGEGGVKISGKIQGFNSLFSPEGTVTVYRGSTALSGKGSVASDGSWSYTIKDSDIPNSGSHTFKVKYDGNTPYNAYSYSSTVSLSVSKRNVTTITVNAPTYNYATASTVTISGSITGISSLAISDTVDIYRNGTKLGSATVTSGTFSYTINTESADVGVYSYWVQYNGNTYYNSAKSDNDTGTINRGTLNNPTFSTGDIVYLNDKTLTVTLKNAKSTVVKNALITLMGKGIVGNLTATTNNNGVATFTISGLNTTTYNDWHIYINQSKNYNALNANAPSFKVTPATLTVTVTSNGDIDADQDEIITVYIKNAKNQNLKDMVAVVTGKDIPQGGVSKTSGDDGIANIAIGNLNPVTTYSDWIVTVYDPNGNYNNVTKNVDEFFVNKGNPRLVIDAPAISYGADAIITIGLPDTANGTVKLYVGLDWNYTLNITNGEYSVTIPRPAAGSYQITAEYSGNERWKPVTATSHLYVERPGAYTYIEVENINYGEEALIKFSIYTNESRTEFLNNTRGSITVYGLNNASGYITKVNNGRAELRVKGLTRGTWNVVSYYSGDNEWKGGISTAAFNVNALKTDLLISANNTILTDYNLWVTVNVNNTINDTVYLYVDGVMYAVAFTTNGKALFNLYNLSAGSHNLTAKFLANDAFDSATNSTMITVNKRDVNYNINLTAQRDIVFNITVNDDIDGLINITGNGTQVGYVPINGNVYYVIEKVKRGLYSFNITYDGNWKYNPFNIVRTINVLPVTDYVLNITSDDAVYNETISIYVHTLSDLDGKNITLTLFGREYNATVSGGVAVFNNIYLVNATTGSFDVGALYVGDDVYGFNQNTTTIPVIPTSRYDIIVKVQESAFVGDDVLINITAPTSKINITINGVRKEIDVGSYILDDVSEGIYDIIASYNGDKMFAAKNSTISSLKVIKQNITLTVSANNTIYGNFTTINVLLSNNVTGLLLIRLDSKEYLYVSLNNQKDAVIIDNTFSVGTHNITVEFLGDTNFNKALNSTVFTISKSNEYNLTVYQNNTLVLNNSDVSAIEGDTFVLTIDLPSDATGHVIVKLLKDSTQINSWDLTLPNNLITYKLKDVGNYTVEIEYSGDTNYTDSEFNFNLNVTPKLIVSNITFTDDNYFVLSDSILNITTNLDNRTLSIFVDGIFYKNVTVNNLKASIDLGKLTAGNHTITVKFDSDEVFTNLYALHNITINKLESGVIATGSDVNQGHMVTVDVVASGNGTANITISNATGVLAGPFTIVISNGKGKFLVPYALMITGEYTINVTYNGDDIYLSNTNSSTFNVLPSDDYLFNIITRDAYVGDEALVNVTLPGNANKNVILTFANGTNVSIAVVNGNALFKLANLAYGNYTVNVTYVGDNNYQKVTKEAKFSVDKRIIDLNLTTNATDGSLAEGFIGSTVQADNLNLTITLADDATGKVNVYLNDNLVAENLDLINGKVSTILNGFNVGVDTVKVVYFGDDKYWNNTGFGNILVASDYGRLNVTVDRKTYIVDDNVDLIIKSNAGGNVSIYVNGKLLDTLWINKELTYTLNNITYGEKNILVILHANENYTGVFNTTNFTVIKKNTTLDVDIVGSSASLPVTIVITVEDGVTGWISALINGTTPQTASGLIENNEVVLTFYGLEVGNHTVVINYEGDDRFNVNSTNKTFSIVKSYYFPVNVTVEDVYVGDNATVSVILPDGARGLINITLNNQHFTGILNNSRVNITIPYTAINHEGKYVIVVAYNGSAEFNATKVTSSFNVLRISKYPFIINVSDIKYGDMEVLNITLPGDINNTVVKVYINNELYNVTIIDGSGELDLSSLTVGSKSVRVVFDGNYKYVESNATDRFVVSPKDVLLNVSVVVNDLTARVNVNATPGINETIHVYVAGSNKTVKLVNGIGSVLFTDLVSRNYTVLAVFEGSENYTAASNKTSFTIDKLNFNITINVNNIKVGDIETITVKVPNTVTGIDLKVNGTVYHIYIVNGTGSINITKLTSGNYSVVAVYEGDDLYNPVNKTAEFVVSKISDYEMNVTYTNVTGNATKVTVTLPDDATGLVTINVNGTNFTGVIYKGKAVIDVVNLTNPIYPYIAIWEGNEKYVNTSKSGIIRNTEYREDSRVIVSVEDILVTQSAVIKINVTSGATGTVRITVNGKNIVVPLVNSGAVYTLAGLSNGTYKVDVVYSGDDIYITNENSTTFNVNKYNSTINVAPGTGKVGENITVVVSGPGDANGTVEITINGTKYSAVMVNGIALLNVSFNKQGTYTVVANYVGNNKYNGNSSDSIIVVDPLTPNVNITVSDIKVGENATVTVFVPGDATGNVTLEIVGGSYRQTVAVSAGKAVFTIPGLGNGTYNIMATFNGDGKYDVMSNVSSFNVTKIDIVPDVRANPIVENKTNITVYVPNDVNGNLILVVGDRTITSPITDGTARFNLDNVGNGTNVNFVFDGDDKYNKFNISAILYDSGIKLSSALSIMISNILVGDNATITVGVTERATGNITINIDGRTFTKVIQDGKVTFTVGDLAYGTYNVTATYSGDDKFLSSNITSSIFVAKYTSVVVVIVDDINVGDNATITVKVLDDATGNVSLKINGIGYDPVIISGGKAVFTISGLGNGTYTAVATYNGNAKYLNSTGNATFKVSKIDINPDVNSTSVLDNKTTVTVIVPGDATGNITIVVGGKNFTEAIDNGKAVINLNNVSDGTPISVVYAGDDKYNEFAVDAVITDQGVRLNPQVIVVSDKDKYLAGETAVITITVPNDAKGNVTIKIRGETVNISDISDGKVIYNYVVPTSGNFNVEVIYNGDNKYASERNTTSFTADKINATVIIDVNNTPVGKNVTVVVTVPNDATGNITITVGSTQYSKAIDNGTVVFNLPALDRNTYEVIANYEPLGDLKYLGGKNSTKFDVTGKSTGIEVTAEAITYGENAEIIVRVDSNATGHISITVGNDTYLGNIDNNGVARIIVPNLKPGIVNFEVSYDGDINFDGNSTASSVTVNRKTTNVEVSADNITDEETAVITVVVPSDATGTVTITVDGKNYTESVNNGVASFNITGLSAGRYLIDAVYNGDTYWNVGENATVWFTVRTSKTIHVETISRGYNSGLDYQAVFTDEFGNPLANTNVTFAVGGKEYTVLTDENGVASLNIGLAPGNHTIVAVNPVTGDESYNTTNIVPRLVENKPVVMDFADGSKFAVRAIGDDGKPVGAGEKVLMFVNGITYEVITDETGLAELTINLNPNWYLITAQYKGYTISDNIEVKQILTAKKVQKVKKSKKKNKVKAKLMFSNGKPLSGVKVTMKIKSKILTAKTNSKGVAKFKLSKKVVKKLKVGKKYRVTFTYLTNTINKHIKVKR